MTTETRLTAFVTGAAGFLGTELVKVLRSRGHQVFGLARSVEGAERLRRAGAVAVRGDLFEDGQWQDEAAADWVFHVAPHSGCRRLARGAVESAARVSMDAHLLDMLATAPTRRIVYVADASYYGATGVRPITEDQAPRPYARGGASRRRWLVWTDTSSPGCRSSPRSQGSSSAAVAGFRNV